jgi:hypothetical protein
VQEVELNKKIYIHVGPPKTGTSAVQKWLSSNQAILQQQGVLYPSHKVDANGVSSGNVNCIYDIDDNKQIQLNKTRLDSLLGDFQASQFSILLLSSEFFFRQMDELKSLIPEAKFIAYIRNPLETKESSYNQSVKRHFQVKELNTVRRKQLPFMVRLVEFSEQFGHNDLILRLYGGTYFYRNNIVSDILFVMGIDMDVSLPIVNSSYQFEALEFKRWFNQFHLDTYQDMVDRSLQGFIAGNETYSLIQQDQYVDDGTYYAVLLKTYAKSMNTSALEPLISDMKSLTAKPFFPQKLSEKQFLSVCQYLQKTLRLDYYLLTQEVKLLSPIQNAHFKDLFINSCNRKYRYIHFLLVGRSYLRRLVKKSIKTLSLKF